MLKKKKKPEKLKVGGKDTSLLNPSAKKGQKTILEAIDPLKREGGREEGRKIEWLIKGGK